MWLVLDIGNSATKGGFFEGDQLRSTFRLEAPSRQDQSTWKLLLKEQLLGQTISHIGIASVVPDVQMHFEAVFAEWRLPVVIIRHTMPLPFALAYLTPETLGTDRLAAAAAAWTLYAEPGRPVVAIDAGTAVTCDVVDASGVYLGGTIAPGPALLRKALSQGTAQLPTVPLLFPPAAIGRSTTEALQAGIMVSFVESVRGVLSQIRVQLGKKPVVVATGGWSTLLADHLALDHTDPHLVLRGIQALMHGTNDPDAS